MKLRLMLAGIVTLTLCVVLSVHAKEHGGETAAHAHQAMENVSSMRPQNAVSEQSERENPKGATRVTVTGDAIVQAQPDTAIIMIAVVTQNPSASEAQAENASKSDRVMNTLKTLLGPNAEIKTSGYILQPRRIYKENQPPTISGYEARNTVTVTMGDLTRVGAVIDAATRAGANSVDNLQFTLRRDRPSRDQALTEATQKR